MNHIYKQIIKDNANRSDIELLNWAMNQLFRAARTMDMLSIGHGENMVGQGCDATATVILKKLVKSKHGYAMVKQCNPKLLWGYKAPK